MLNETIQIGNGKVHRLIHGITFNMADGSRVRFPYNRSMCGQAEYFRHGWRSAHWNTLGNWVKAQRTHKQKNGVVTCKTCIKLEREQMDRYD